MSDIRTKLLLGTSIGALAMIFVMAVGVDAFDTTTTTAIQSIGLNGHVTVMAVHPDGSASYAQGDNTIADAGLNPAASQLFDTATAAAGGTFNCIRIGTGDGTAGEDIQTPMVTTSAQSCDAASALVAGAPLGDIAIDAPFTMEAGDLLDNGATTVTITEAVLENQAGNEISHVGLSTGVIATLGTIVTITYTMTLAGP